MKLSSLFIFSAWIFFISDQVISQESNGWHNKKREIHYVPQNGEFVLKNGKQKFNRALYGTNTAFRVETGDVPEFAMYMPGMGGNFKLGIQNGQNSKWLPEADNIQTTYSTGKMSYEIQDEMLGDEVLEIEILALAEDEGFILKVDGDLGDANLIWAYGGASGRKFSRSGDIGADPETVFYLLSEYTHNNEFQINKKNSSFLLDFGWDSDNKRNTRKMAGFFPASEVKLGSAENLESPQDLFNSEADSLPVITGKITILPENAVYWKIYSKENPGQEDQKTLKNDWYKAEKKLEQYAKRVTLKTPDPYLNTLGGALAYAADAVWEDPAYVHGAVAWRMHLNGWRGGYIADLLGWRDRAKTLFTSYSNSQVLEPASGPVVPDTVRNFARQKEEIGTTIFTEGYISRHPNRNDVAHHYDMNLVFIDQMLNHFQWTGDEDFIKELWPVIKRHLAWEKRNFDTDNDGLYDAYAAIWASDALQYSGGGVTYTSAYNYRANKMAAKLAQIAGEDPGPYLKEAEKIHNALQRELWIPEKGVFAEYKDLLGNQLLHKNPGIWTVYHAIDEGVSDAFQQYQMLNYVDTEIPHIPVKAEGLEKDDLYLLSTTNWQPYTWSVNNVALAENLHMALAYWQGGKADEAFKLWESALTESMYLGASPGGFHQLSFYDAIRGELYRDFADPIAMVARTLVEGLFGIRPQALEDTLILNPEFPKDWKNASLTIPDISFSYKRNGKTEKYEVSPRFNKQMNLKLKLGVPNDEIQSVTINGEEADWSIDKNSVGSPELVIEGPYHPDYSIVIEWKGKDLESLQLKENYHIGEKFNLQTSQAEIKELKDPQKILEEVDFKDKSFEAAVNSEVGNRSFFLKLKQGEIEWWYPVNISVKPQLEIISNNLEGENILLEVKNWTEHPFAGKIVVNSVTTKNEQEIDLKPNGLTTINLSEEQLIPGTNRILFEAESGEVTEVTFQNWDLEIDETQKLEKIEFSTDFNSKVTEIFENKYHSPRPDVPTLQLPTTGIGNWAYNTIEVNIDDSGLREKAGEKEEILTPQGIPFKTPSAKDSENIAFVSQWDAYPEEIEIPLEGTASHAYFLMAGSTNPMQSRFVNGEVIMSYTDGTSEVLKLKNPQNWWPIEQDYYVDGYAFTTDAPKPPRLYFKTGKITRDFEDFVSIKGYSDFAIDGGAGTVLDLPLDAQKELKNVTLRAVANDVVIGLMSLTLVRN